MNHNNFIYNILKELCYINKNKHLMDIFQDMLHKPVLVSFY